MQNRTRVAFLSLMVVGSAALPLATAPLAAASSMGALCSPSTVRVTTIVDNASQGWGPFTLFLGSVRFTNRGVACVLSAGKVTTRTEVGYPGHPSPIGASSSGLRSSRITLSRGASASVQVRVDGSHRRGWSAKLPCGPRMSAAGLLVTGPGWFRGRFVAFAHSTSYCGLRLFTSTGTLQRDG